MLDWGWRLPFILALLPGIVSLAGRRGLKESQARRRTTWHVPTVVVLRLALQHVGTTVIRGNIHLPGLGLQGSGCRAFGLRRLRAKICLRSLRLNPQRSKFCVL